MQESVTYQQMFAKVEAIVQSVASTEVELETMVDKVEEGFKLIGCMRERLEQTKQRIDVLKTQYESQVKELPANSDS